MSAEARILAAEKQVKEASAEAARAAKRLEQTKRRRRRVRKAEGLGELLAGVEPIVRDRVQTAHRAGSDATERGRKVGRRARKAAGRAARDVKKRAER